MAVIGATLSLPFAAKFVILGEGAFPLHVATRLPVALISAVGIALLLYAHLALDDIQHHIVENWEKAGYARTSSLKPCPLVESATAGGSFSSLAAPQQ